MYFKFVPFKTRHHIRFLLDNASFDIKALWCQSWHFWVEKVPSFIVPSYKLLLRNISFSDKVTVMVGLGRLAPQTTLRWVLVELDPTGCTFVIEPHGPYLKARRLLKWLPKLVSKLPSPEDGCDKLLYFVHHKLYWSSVTVTIHLLGWLDVSYI